MNYTEIREASPRAILGEKVMDDGAILEAAEVHAAKSQMHYERGHWNEAKTAASVSMAFSLVLAAREVV